MKDLQLLVRRDVKRDGPPKKFPGYYYVENETGGMGTELCKTNGEFFTGQDCMENISHYYESIALPNLLQEIAMEGLPSEDSEISMADEGNPDDPEYNGRLHGATWFRQEVLPLLAKKNAEIAELKKKLEDSVRCLDSTTDFQHKQIVQLKEQVGELKRK